MLGSAKLPRMQTNAAWQSPVIVIATAKAPDWDAGTAYTNTNPAALYARHNNQNWIALAASTGIVPGTDATKWALAPDLGAGAGGPVPVDTRGWTVTGRVQGLSAALDLTTDNGRLSFDQNAAQIVATLTQADCAALGAGKAVFEFMHATSGFVPRPIGRIALVNYAGV